MADLVKMLPADRNLPCYAAMPHVPAQTHTVLCELESFLEHNCIVIVHSEVQEGRCLVGSSLWSLKELARAGAPQLAPAALWPSSFSLHLFILNLQQQRGNIQARKLVPPHLVKRFGIRLTGRRCSARHAAAL